jgi:hypothetical protein
MERFPTLFRLWFPTVDPDLVWVFDVLVLVERLSLGCIAAKPLIGNVV